MCFDSEVSNCTITYLKKLKKDARNSSVKKQEFAKMCLLLFCNKLDDLLFMSALAENLFFANFDELREYINMNKNSLKKILKAGLQARGTGGIAMESLT